MPDRAREDPTGELAPGGWSGATMTGGATIWLTGVPAAGKSTIAAAACEALATRGARPVHIDGDDLRRGLNSDLDFTASGRSEAVRRAGEVASLLAAAGLVAVVSLVSPYLEDRLTVRNLHLERGLPFVEVWVSAPLEVCALRDPKGLYARAGRGELRGLTGVDDPYEPPTCPEADIPTDRVGVPEAVSMVLEALNMALGTSPGHGPGAAADTTPSGNAIRSTADP